MGYEYVEGVFGGQAICLKTAQMRVSKPGIKSAVFYGKPNNTETFYHIVISQDEDFIDGESTITVAVFGLAGEKAHVQDWYYNIATLETDAIVFHTGFTIDELLVFDRIVMADEVKKWSEYTRPFIDQSEIDYQFTLIEQTDDKISLLAHEFGLEMGVVEGKIEITSDKIESTVYKSLLSSAIAVLRQDVSGNIDTLPVESLKEDLPKGTELVIVDIDTLQTYTVITREDANKNATQILIDATTITANKNSTVHLELSSVASKIAQLADSYTLNIEGDGVVTGFKSALGEDGVSDFVIQADKFRVVGTKNGQPFGEGKSIFEVDTDDEKIYLNSDVVLRGNIVQAPDGEEYPIPVFRGKYSETYTYHKYDQVSHDGAVWIFMSDTPKTGEEPVIGSPYWDIYVEKGESAPEFKVEYSANQNGPWSSSYVEGHFWMRTSNDGGNTWSASVRIVGEDGVDGQDGKYTDYQFAKNTSLTTAPSSGWDEVPPSLGVDEYLWMRSRVVTPSGAGDWSTAVRISGPKGDKGDKGDTGDTGPAGQGIVYRGNWQASETYYYTDVRRDVVTYNNKPYLFNVPTTNNGIETTSWSFSQWKEFGATFDSVATKLLLAEDAFIEHTLNVGQGGTKSAGVSGEEGIRFWAGSTSPTSAPFRVEESGKVVATNAEIKGKIEADSGYFKGSITGATGEFHGTLKAGTITADMYKQIRNVLPYVGTDNIDESNPIDVDFYIPEETESIVSISLSAKALRYRAYAKTASSGGSHTHSVVVPGHKHGIETVNIDGAGVTDFRGGHDHGGSVSEAGFMVVSITTRTSGSHTHSVSGSTDSDTHSHGVTVPPYSGGYTDSSTHSHSVSGTASSDGSHSGHIDRITSSGHGHNITSVNDHAHGYTYVRWAPVSTTESGGATTITSASSDAHTHNLDYGIQLNTTPANVKLYCDNGSGYGSAISLNLQPSSSSEEYILATEKFLAKKGDTHLQHFTGYGWKRIRFTSTRRGRITWQLIAKLDITAQTA